MTEKYVSLLDRYSDLQEKHNSLERDYSYIKLKCDILTYDSQKTKKTYLYTKSDLLSAVLPTIFFCTIINKIYNYIN